MRFFSVPAQGGTSVDCKAQCQSACSRARKHGGSDGLLHHDRACAVAVAETHASNPDCRDLDTSQKTLLHVIPPCEVREPRARIAPFGRLGVITPSYETQITGGRSRFEIGGTASA